MNKLKVEIPQPSPTAGSSSNILTLNPKQNSESQQTVKDKGVVVGVKVDQVIPIRVGQRKDRKYMRNLLHFQGTHIRY